MGGPQAGPGHGGGALAGAGRVGAGPSHLCLLQPWLHRPRLQAKSQFKRRSTANNVEIHIPVPNDADSPKFKTTVGSVKWVPENSEIVWSIKSFPVSTLLSGVPLDFLPRPACPLCPSQHAAASKRGMGPGSPRTESRGAGQARRESWSRHGQLVRTAPSPASGQHPCLSPSLLPSLWHSGSELRFP